jgi:hypothetical protein
MPQAIFRKRPDGNAVTRDSPCASSEKNRDPSMLANQRRRLIGTRNRMDFRTSNALIGRNALNGVMQKRVDMLTMNDPVAGMDILHVNFAMNRGFVFH